MDHAKHHLLRGPARDRCVCPATATAGTCRRQFRQGRLVHPHRRERGGHGPMFTEPTSIHHQSGICGHDECDRAHPMFQPPRERGREPPPFAPHRGSSTSHQFRGRRSAIAISTSVKRLRSCPQHLGRPRLSAGHAMSAANGTVGDARCGGHGRMARAVICSSLRCRAPAESARGWFALIDTAAIRASVVTQG